MSFSKDLFGNDLGAKTVADRAMLAPAFAHVFHEISDERLASFVTNEFQAVLEYSELLAGGDTCLETTLLFNPHRLSVRAVAFADPISKLRKQDSHKNTARLCLWLRKSGTPIRGVLTRFLGIGAGFAAVTDFPPYVARDLYARYGTTMRSSVLDPCAGWGGRMLGASVVCNSYTCIDASVKTCKGLRRLSEFIRRIRPKFNAHVTHAAFEDVELDSMYDIALTSPPYFDIERYSDCEEDSATRYKTLEAWTKGFFEPLVERTMQHIKRKGVFLLNISNRKYPLDDLLQQFAARRYKLRRLYGVRPDGQATRYKTRKNAQGIASVRAGVGEQLWEIKHK